VVLLLEGVLVSWSLAMDERSGHEDLHGSGHRIVIPYVQVRMELYCSSLPCLSMPFCPTVNLFSTPRKRYLPDPFITQRRVVTMRLVAR
jgi:hypothetical protein